VCTADASQPPDPIRNRIEAVNAFEPPSSSEKPEISPVVLNQVTEEAGPKGTQPGNHRNGSPDETTQFHLAVEGYIRHPLPHEFCRPVVVSCELEDAAMNDNDSMVGGYHSGAA
jgi:hypothetical protein